MSLYSHAGWFQQLSTLCTPSAASYTLGRDPESQLQDFIVFLLFSGWGGVG